MSGSTPALDMPQQHQQRWDQGSGARGCESPLTLPAALLPQLLPHLKVVRLVVALKARYSSTLADPEVVGVSAALPPATNTPTQQLGPPASKAAALMPFTEPTCTWVGVVEEE